MEWFELRARSLIFFHICLRNHKLMAFSSEPIEWIPWFCILCSNHCWFLMQPKIKSSINLYLSWKSFNNFRAIMPHVPAAESIRIGNMMTSVLKRRVGHILTLSEVREYIHYFLKCNCKPSALIFFNLKLLHQNSDTIRPLKAMDKLPSTEQQLYREALKTAKGLASFNLFSISNNHESLVHSLML